MSLSACDIGNPIYDKSNEPQYRIRKLVTILEDDSANDFGCEIEYHYYLFEGRSYIVYYSFKPLDTFHMTEMSMAESVRDVIAEREVWMAKFECNGEMKN